MVTVLGSATTGDTGHGTGHLPLPQPTMTRTAHRPWCADCKRKHDADQLDDDGRCAKCARAAVSRAAAAAAREQRAEEIAALEKAAQVDVAKDARETGTVVRRTTKLPKEGKQGQPTTRPQHDTGSAPGATPTSSTTGRAPGAGSSTTEKPSAGTPAETAHRQDPAGAPGIVLPIGFDALLTNAIDALTALHAAITQTPAPATSTPAAAGHTSAGPREGEAPSRRTRGPRAVTPADLTIGAEYRTGDTIKTIAERHGMAMSTVRRSIDRLGIERRDDRATQSGGRNRYEPTADQVTTIRHRYVDLEDSIADIADDLGIHRRIVARILTDNGVTIRPAAHLAGTVLTDDMAAAIAERYQAGSSIAELCRKHHLRNDRVREALQRAGIEVRPKGASARNSQRLADLGTTAHDVKVWAVETGRADRITAGIVPAALIDAWQTAHQHPDTSSTTNPTGDTAA